MACEKCGKRIQGNYRDHCEDCYADAQPYWGEYCDDPLTEEPDGLELELVPAGMLDIEEIIRGGWAVV